MSYVELRTRSAFSFLSGASLPEDLIDRAAALGYSAIALGDRDGVYGAPRFHRAAREAGLRALIGCELTMRSYSLYALVTSRSGYRNLCRLLTHAKLRAKKGEGFVTWGDLEGYTEGLICLLREGVAGPRNCGAAKKSCLPPDSRPSDLWEKEVVMRLGSLFPRRLYIELQRHLDPDEERFNRILIDLARHYRIPLVATNDVRHATRKARPLLDVLTCIREKTHLDAAGRLLLRNAERHLKSPQEMAALFRDLPEAIRNTQRIAEECEFTLADLGYRFPDYPLPAGETPIGHLRALTDRGARERYGTITPRVRRQLEHEIEIIGKLDLAGYFLIVWDIVRFCREQGILAQGRGSAANSAVCYALGITAVDPIGMDLLFERFLSEERGEWPDIDIDLPSGERREQVIQYIYRRYGERGAAMTANVITYRTRSAVREVGKALGFSLAQVDRLSKLLHRFEFRDDLDELGAQLQEGGVDPTAPRVQLLTKLVQQIQHLPRHLGQHSGGMVICGGRLDQVVPLEPASMPGRVVVQWDKDDCADLGIVKVDLLGLGMMAVLEEAIPLIREHEGVEIDLAHLPPDDPKTYDMLRRADTIGVFQLESRAQMATLPRMQPERFYDLVVEVGIIRPGPIVGQMVHPYLDRRNGREPVTYAHPDLEPILERTLGVPLFQEQLLRMAMTLAGFSGGEAEELRRAMGCKRSVERMEQIEKRLREGMARRGIHGRVQDEIVRSITSFALYGFPESHAASFALLAYASAYLRAHHLAAYTCALLNHWPMGFYHPATIVKDAQRHGLRVLPIDVTRSNWRCSIEQVARLFRCDVVREEEDGKAAKPWRAETADLTTDSLTTNNLSLRLGLRFVSGLREEVGKRIEEERARASFTSIADVIHRCKLRDGEVQTLAQIGAFAAFGLTRRAALWQAAAVPREPLLRLLGCYDARLFGTDGETDTAAASGIHRTTNNLKTNNFPRRSSDGTIIQSSSGVAAGDEPGAGWLLPDQTIFPRGAIRAHRSDAARRGVRTGKHRRRQRPIDQEGLYQLPPNHPGQPARTGDIPPPDHGGEAGELPSSAATSAAGRIRGEAAQPPDPVTRESSSNSETLTTNNRTTSNPLPEMSSLDRTLADYAGTGLTVGPHIVKYLRDALAGDGVLRAVDLKQVRDGRWVKIAGLVIVRQRPGTAKGFCFLTLEDETGTANAVVAPDIFQRFRSVIHTAAMLILEGPLQRVETESLSTNNLTTSSSKPPSPVIHIRAKRITELHLPQQAVTLTGHGYRMRVTPADQPPTGPNNQPPNNEQPVSLPKSHDFR